MTIDGREKRRTAAFEQLARMIEGVGFPHVTARIYAALVLAPGEGQSTGELIEQLGISKASVSNATQFLVGTELVEQYRVPGSRQAHYRILKGAWGPMLARKFAATSAITRIVEEAMDVTESDAATERLEEMHDVYSFFEHEFAGIMKRWEERENR